MTAPLRLSACAIDLRARVIVRDGHSQALTDHEASLLTYLSERPGEAISRDVLLQEVWGYSPTVHSRAVDQTIKRLRPKIEANPKEPAHLITVKGVGYRLEIGTDAVPTNVAPAVDRFIGRVDSLATLRERLCGDARWLTVTGSGGIGKTRLAAEFARLAHPDFQGGVWLCDLAQTADADDMIGRISDVLQLAPSSSTAGALSALTSALNRFGRVLLVLDNLEQATMAAAQLGHTLLSSTPDVRVLATSRARLGLRGEHVLALPPLDVPEGVKLLVDRARHLRSDTVWSAGDPDVVEIVRRLDCLPLALELAAARVVLLSPSQLLSRLDRRLDVLRGGPPGRHSTLRNAIDWSWQLLSEPEQRAMSRLSVFRGGFSLDEAERVIGDPEALDRLQVLVDRSLVQRLPTGRLALLESIRQFSEEQLRADGQWEVAVDAHAEALLALAQSHAHHDPTGWTVIGPLDAECDNLLAVVERQRDRDPERSAEALLHALGPLRRRRSAAAVCELLDRALGTRLPDAQRSRVLQARAVLSADPVLAQASMYQALDLARDNPDEQFRAGLAWGRWLSEAGRPEEALEVLGSLDAPPGPRGVELQVQIAIAHARLGDWTVANTTLNDLVRVAKGPMRAMPLHALGFASLEFGLTDVASNAFERAVAIDPEKRPVLVGLLGIAELAKGNLAAATPFLEQSRAHSHHLGDAKYMGEDDALSGYIAHLQGKLERADELYRSAQVLLRNGGKMKEIAHVWAYRAVLAMQRGDVQATANAQAEVVDWSAIVEGSDTLLLAETLATILDEDQATPVFAEGARAPIEVRRLVALVG